MKKEFLLILLVSGLALSAHASLLQEDDKDEICASDYGMTVELSVDGFETSTGDCEYNMNPNYDLSELEINDNRSFIQAPQGVTQ